MKQTKKKSHKQPAKRTSPRKASSRKPAARKSAGKVAATGTARGKGAGRTGPGGGAARSGKGLKESLRRGSARTRPAAAGKKAPAKGKGKGRGRPGRSAQESPRRSPERTPPARAPEKGEPSPPPPSRISKGPAYPPPPVSIPSAKGKPGTTPTPAKPPRPTMPWPTGTSTAGLRVASKDGLLPPKPLQAPPPPPKRRILDSRPIGKIARTDISERGIRVTLENGAKLTLPYGLWSPEDVATITIALDGEGLVISLRNGEALEYSLMRIRALSEALESGEGS